MIFLDVPYKEKDIAKKLGAWWHSGERRWYAPKGEKELIERWPCSLKEINHFPGEDTNFGGNLLFVDLIPRSCWFTNVRYCIKREDWDRVRSFVYRRAKYRCEACGIQDKLEGHERWFYDDKSKVQQLKRIITLCTDCHEVTHMGLAQIRGRGDEAFKHLMAVRKWSKRETDQHIEEAFELWRLRNQYDWQLDLSIIINAGITPAKKVASEERSKIAKTNVLENDNFKADKEVFIDKRDNIIIASEYEKQLTNMAENQPVIDTRFWHRIFNKLKSKLKI